MMPSFTSSRRNRFDRVRPTLADVFDRFPLSLRQSEPDGHLPIGHVAQCSASCYGVQLPSSARPTR